MTRGSTVLVEVNNLEKTFQLRQAFSAALRAASGQFVHAVAGVSLQIRKGESLGLVGQSGSGKSTLGQLLCLLERPTSGTITFEGVDISRLSGQALKAFRRKVQIVFQDPYESLNPRYRVEETVTEPLVIHRIGRSQAERRELVSRTLEMVELRPPERYLRAYPHELSGGERQRVAVARAIVLDPTFLVADEPVSMLDVSVRSGLLNLLLKLKAELGMTYLFITHDLSVARYMCDRLAIMYHGKIVELGVTETVLANPVHPYTRLLIASVPVPDPTVVRPLPVLDPVLSEMSSAADAQLVEVEPNHFVAHHPALSPTA